MDGYKPFGSASSGVDGESGNADSLSQPADFLTLRSGNASGDGSGSDSGDSSGDSGDFDPAIHVSPDKRNRDGSFTRKRGRKAGSAANSASGGYRRSGRKDAGYQANIESLTSVLAIVHAGLASATKTPELALDTDEAESLAKASANVLIEFDIQPNPKVQAVVGLVMTAGSLYGPRVYLIRERRKEEREERKRRDG